MEGHSIAGMSTTRKRVENDFYATPENSTKALLEVEEIIYPVLEPACGEGHIAKLLGDEMCNQCQSCAVENTTVLGCADDKCPCHTSTQTVIASDLVDRGYGLPNFDFLNPEHKYQSINTIITNPPFNLFQEFVEQALKVANKKVIMFGKLQALEGQKRATFMENSPLKTVYVFKARQNPLRNGSPVDENGKPWASTMAFAWYVWEIGFIGKPTIQWI
jgi:hypothetical protein